MTFKVKAKPISEFEVWNQGFEVDEQGYVEGYFVAPRYLLGHIVESTDEYIIPEFWCIIDVKTIQEVDAI